MGQWLLSPLVQVMACRQCQTVTWINADVNYTIKYKLPWKFYKRLNIFVRRNSFENAVCKMVNILSWSQYVTMMDADVDSTWYDNFFLTSDQLIMLPGEHFKNAYELLNPGALKFSPVNRIPIFQCMGKIFSKSTFEIPHKIFYPYIERCYFDKPLQF